MVEVFISPIENVYLNIAIEKGLLDEAGDCLRLMLWSNDNTVVIGRHQNLNAEVNVDIFEREGGSIARRFSGGGAVYHDRNNLNFTFIAPNSLYSVDRQLSVILKTVRAFGIDAEKNGRNDITVDGRKFSGNAFLNTKTHGMHHGTLLIDTDTERMARYLSVDRSKLQKKGVKSVESRVINLSRIADIDKLSLIEVLLKEVEKEYGDIKLIGMDGLDMRKAEGLAEMLRSDEWKFGKGARYERRATGVNEYGLFEVLYSTENGRISAVEVYSDALDVDMIEEAKRGLLNCDILDTSVRTDCTGMLARLILEKSNE